MNNTLTDQEQELLDRITLLAVYNGNHIDTKSYDPTPEEYRMLFDIRKKLNLN